MEDIRKLSIKRVEISLNNFNDVAIPHHVDLLKKHKTHICKFHALGDLDRIKKEQINATRIVRQLRHLLEEMEILRKQVIIDDVPKFDKITRKSRDLASRAIKDYLDMPQYSESAGSSGYSSNSPTLQKEQESAGVMTGSKTQLQESDSSLSDQLHQQQLVLESWEDLNTELQDINELFVKLDEVVHAQGENVSRINDHIEMTSVNVENARKSLSKAEKYKLAMYPLAGAIIGGCVAGPIGLLTGLKIGGLAFLGGSALGFTGGRILKKRQDNPIDLDENKLEKKDA